MQLTAAGRALFDSVATDSEAIYREIEAAFGRQRLQALMAELGALTTICESLPDLSATRPPATAKEAAQ